MSKRKKEREKDLRRRANADAKNKRTFGHKKRGCGQQDQYGACNGFRDSPLIRDVATTYPYPYREPAGCRSLPRASGYPNSEPYFASCCSRY